MMKVLESMTSDRGNAAEYTAEALEHRLRTSEEPLFLNEYFAGGQATKLYFDFDKYLDREPPEAEVDEDLQAVMRDARRVLVAAGQTHDMPEPDFAIASRHGSVQRRNQQTTQYKVSFRVFSTNYAVADYVHLGNLVKGTCLDPSVYKAREQLLNLVWCRKNPRDPRVLEPMDPSRPLHHFFASHLTGTEIVLDASSSTPTAGPSRAIVVATPAPAPPMGIEGLLCDNVTKLLYLLQKTRWDAYQSWINIGIALKNIGRDAGEPDKYRQTWVRMSAISPKYDQAECESKWDSAGFLVSQACLYQS
jgi:hypothetical protein